MFCLFSPYISLHPDGKVIYVKNHSIASSVGIAAQDKIIKFNDKEVSSLKNVSKYVTSQDKLCIEWENKSGTHNDCVNNNKKKIGVTFSMSLWQGTVFTAHGFMDLLKSYVNGFFTVLFHLNIKDFNGPVGALDVIQQSVPVWTNFASVLIMVNLALGAANLLLPLSLTDGGKIVIDIICLITRRKYLNTKYLDYISVALMFGLFAITFFLDISRIVGRLF
jgi:membrane-associated protease RseP (regulator of RpoE activity)